MIRSLLPGAVLLLATGPLAGQVDSSRIAAVRTRAQITRFDTTSVRIQRPVSRVVLETAWATADTQSAQSGTTAIRRPAWSSQVVLRKRLARVRVGDQSSRVAVAARRIPPRTAVTVTARDDSTITRQRATDFRVRAEAISRVDRVTAARIHPTVAANLISELDSVGASRLASAGPDGPDGPAEEEGYAEYVVSLSRAVSRLKDPRSVRALVLGGLGTSREIQRFVAGQGQAGLAALDTAFAASDATAPAVVTTWGYSLGASPSQLTYEDSVYIYARIVMSAQYYPVSFAYATRHANLFELLPELDSLAARAAADNEPAAAGAARAASRALAPMLASATAADWLARLRLRTGVLCMDDSRLGLDACRTLLGATVTAARSLGDLAQVRQAMNQYRGQLDASTRAGRLSAQSRGSLDPLVAGLLRASGDRQIRAPVARPDLLRPAIRRPPG